MSSIEKGNFDNEEHKDSALFELKEKEGAIISPQELSGRVSKRIENGESTEGWDPYDKNEYEKELAIHFSPDEWLSVEDAEDIIKKDKEKYGCKDYTPEQLALLYCAEDSLLLYESLRKGSPVRGRGISQRAYVEFFERAGLIGRIIKCKNLKKDQESEDEIMSIQNGRITTKKGYNWAIIDCTLVEE